MSSKITQKKPHRQHRPPIAGIFPGDFNTEFIADRRTQTLHVYTNGQRINFADLHGDITVHFYERMLKDEVAMQALRHMEWQAALERFVYCLYGAADGTPDISDFGSIGPAENFDCGITDCTCSTWPSKKITINGTALTPREVETVIRLASDKPDKQIADEMGISTHTLVQHKTNAYRKAAVQSRAGLITKAFNHNIIQP